MMTRNASRSAEYQYKLTEKSWDPIDICKLEIYQEEVIIDERISDLRDTLIILVKKLAKKRLSKDEWIIFDSIWIKTKTQQELAKTLKINQSIVCKKLASINMKLKEYCYESKEILDILDQINGES